MTQITLKGGRLEDARADAIIVNLFEGVRKPGGATGAIDRALGGAITAAMKLGDVKGKLREALVLPTNGKLRAKRVIVVGLGEPKKFDADAARQASARAAFVARERGCKSLATVVHGAGAGGLEVATAGQALAEGALLGLYEFKEYKTKASQDGDDPKRLDRILVVESDAAKRRILGPALKAGQAIANVTCDVRTLVNRPSMDKTPPVLGKTAVAWARKRNLKVRVFQANDLRRLKMGGILGVGSGSAHPPLLVVIEKPGTGKPILLVGKGITFDTGGISIKPSQGMDLMRHDMAGAAAVLGAICLAADLKLKRRVVALLPIAENMPSGTAIRPGDILRAYNGTTIEVANTDAEGRLILADALSYGVKTYKPESVVDIATLTGSVKVALGTITTGLFSNDDALSNALIEAGKAVGDDVWRLPLNDEYKRHVKSDVADVKNTGVNWGGSITAAAFLQHFVGKAKWAHLDIAGTCWTEKGNGDLRQDYHAKGATGMGVRLLAEFLAQAG